MNVFFRYLKTTEYVSFARFNTIHQLPQCLQDFEVTLGKTPFYIESLRIGTYDPGFWEQPVNWIMEIIFSYSLSHFNMEFLFHSNRSNRSLDIHVISVVWDTLYKFTVTQVSSAMDRFEEEQNVSTVFVRAQWIDE